MMWFHIAIALISVAILAYLINGRVSIPPTIRTVVNIVLVLIVIGIALWVINAYIPMAGSIRAILNLVVVIACCVFVLRAVGLWPAVTRTWYNLTHRSTG